MRIKWGVAARIAASFVLVGSLAACSTTRQGRSVEPSGFLSDYSALEKGGKGQAQLRYVNPATDFSQYDKIQIDTIAIIAVEGSSLSGMDIHQATLMAAHFRDALVEELGKDYEIVDTPGPGTMRLRAALTEARGSKVVLDTLTTVIPQTRLLATGAQLAADNSATTGKARAEAELLDSLTGERLVAAVDERYGTKALRGSVKKWSDVKSAFSLWAERMRLRLGELRTPPADET